jgi:hypothetical protein
MFKVGFLDHVSPFGRSIRKPGEIETIVSVSFQYIGPFLNFQRNPVCPSDSRGYNTDVFDDTVEIFGFRHNYVLSSPLCENMLISHWYKCRKWIACPYGVKPEKPLRTLQNLLYIYNRYKNTIPEG